MANVCFYYISIKPRFIKIPILFPVAGWLILGLGVIQLPIWMFVSKIKNEGKSYLDVSIKRNSKPP